ncbi:MAG: MBL fold metallo-hydrolase [Spirochaetota bacterium]|nr:MBL fold metallo-hydrolase [Spirochaetota bacterium]
MKIKILGNGGAINDGLPYNAFMIDEEVLIELPPDIMLSLAREDISINNIREIFISHLHGDHCFGFPFLTLYLFVKVPKDQKEKRIKLFAPGNAKDFLIDLTEKAFSKEHPLISWVRETIEFINISDRTEITLNDHTARLFKMEHMVETYGFILKEENENVFSYIADTKWSQGITDLLKEKPQIVILDLNGEPDDPVPIHLHEDEIIEKAINLVSDETVFYGTHLKCDKISTNKRIHYVKAGMEIEI